MKKYLKAMELIHARTIQEYYALKGSGITLASYNARENYIRSLHGLKLVLAGDDSISSDDYVKLCVQINEDEKNFFKETE